MTFISVESIQRVTSLMPGCKRRPDGDETCFPWLSGPRTRNTAGHCSAHTTRTRYCAEPDQIVEASISYCSGAGSTNATARQISNSHSDLCDLAQARCIKSSIYDAFSRIKSCYEGQLLSKSEQCIVQCISIAARSLGQLLSSCDNRALQVIWQTKSAPDRDVCGEYFKAPLFCRIGCARQSIVSPRSLRRR